MENYNEMLKDINLNVNLNVELSDSQKIGFDLFIKGKSMFITSSAGCGKSFLLKEFSKEKDIILTSTTGVSAYNINGMTIHSFLGIGTGAENKDFLINRIITNKSVKKRIEKTKILVIDEISMMSAELFEKIDYIFKYFKKNNSFFGGIQLILTGDLLQLLPVFKTSIVSENLDTRLIINSKLFSENFSKKNIVVLKKNFRQDESEILFIQMLNRIRIGKISDSDISLLNEKCKEFKKNTNFIVPETVSLVSSNKKANEINSKKMKKLSSDEFSYSSTFTRKGKNKETLDLLEKELKLQFIQKGLLDLNFKKGSRVMLIKNLDTENGLINGSTGTILDILKTPIVQFDNGIKRNMTSEDFEIKLNGNTVVGKQIPLILAFAITIHKSQSLTLNNAILDLSDCFTYHMVYVALSRVISLKNVYLKSFNHKKIMVHPEMATFYLE